MSMLLPDPRLYPRVDPDNLLIRLAMALLTEREAGRALTRAEALKDAIAAQLAADDDSVLNAALRHAPSQEVYKAVWQAALDVVGQVGNERHAVIFALPVVLVAGCKGRAELPERLSDVDALSQLLRQHGVIDAQAECFISGKLVHPDTLEGLSFSQLYRYSRNLADAGRGLPVELPGDPAPVKDDCVLVRYLVGVAMREANGEMPVKLGGSMGAWGMPLMQLLGEQLKTANVTLFPIPRVPNWLREAHRQGQAARQEVNLQVFASNIIRKLREYSLPITAIAAAHDNGELRFTISTPGDDKNCAAHAWPLAPLDSVERIAEEFIGLMRECQVEDVRLVKEVQTDREHGIPFFVTVNDPAAQSHGLH